MIHFFSIKYQLGEWTQFALTKYEHVHQSVGNGNIWFTLVSAPETEWMILHMDSELYYYKGMNASHTWVRMHAVPALKIKNVHVSV